jgi:MFS family permease
MRMIFIFTHQLPIDISRRRGLFLGITQVLWIIAGAAGPTVGGALSEHSTWRWIFWINLPISGIAFALILLFLDVHNPRTPILNGLKAIDWVGCLSILTFTLMFLLGLDLGGSVLPWSSAIVICLLFFGCLMVPVFVFYEGWLAKYPMVPLRLFRNSSNVACLVISFTHGFVSRMQYVISQSNNFCRFTFPRSSIFPSTFNPHDRHSPLTLD